MVSDSWREMAVFGSPRTGRRTVRLQVGRRGRTRYVAHLVLTAFVGPCPDGMETCHNNGDCADDRLVNLRWDTHAANLADKIAHGTHNRGSRHNMAKLTEPQVLEIRRRGFAGESRSLLAVEFKVSKTTVAGIINLKRWGHLSA